MKKNNRSNNIILWGLSFGLPWVIIIFPGIGAFQKSVTSWLGLWQIIGELILPCSILGILVAGIQYFLLEENRKIARLWGIASAIGYSLALPLGITLDTLIQFLLTPGLFSGGNTIMIPPVPIAMIIGGMIVGLSQVLVLSKLDSNKQLRTLRFLWVAVSMLSWGLSFWLWINLENLGIHLRIVSSLTGVFIGLFTGLAFLFIKRNINSNKLQAV